MTWFFLQAALFPFRRIQVQASMLLDYSLRNSAHINQLHINGNFIIARTLGRRFLQNYRAGCSRILQIQATPQLCLEFHMIILPQNDNISRESGECFPEVEFGSKITQLIQGIFKVMRGRYLYIIFILILIAMPGMAQEKQPSIYKVTKLVIHSGHLMICTRNYQGRNNVLLSDKRFSGFRDRTSFGKACIKYYIVQGRTVLNGGSWTNWKVNVPTYFNNGPMGTGWKGLFILPVR